jgi:Lar family restriction alleviation protein
MTPPTNTQIETGLKPCPFCAREARVGRVKRMRQGICYHCEAAGPLCETEAGAIHAWNTRNNARSISDDVVEKVADSLRGLHIKDAEGWGWPMNKAEREEATRRIITALSTPKAIKG